MREAIVYICDFCKKKYLRKGNCIKHEPECFFNPKNKTCGTCENFCYKDGEKYCRDLKIEPVITYEEHDPGCIDKFIPWEDCNYKLRTENWESHD